MIATHPRTQLKGRTAMKDLRGKNAILTGASRGLGLYIARALAAQGVNLALAARTSEKLEETKRACEPAGVKIVCVPTDVRSMDNLHGLVGAAERELGNIDILVNNAGIEITSQLDLIPMEELDALLETNLNAPIRLTRLVLPAMRARGSGAIVNIASMAGKAPIPYNTLYAGTKAGLINFTEALCMELRETGVTASVVCPSYVSDAGMWKTHEDAGAKLPIATRAVSPEKVVKGVLRAIRGEPEVIVAPTPMRPLLALGELSPRLKMRVVRAMGVERIFKTESERMNAAQQAREERETPAGGGD
jgi:short-subunit dehydrogenase